MNYSLKLQVNNEDSWGVVNLIPLATLNVHSHFKNMYVGECYFRVRVCGHTFMCVCGDWRRTVGASVNHVSPLFCFCCFETVSLTEPGACWWAGVANDLAPVGCCVLSLQR